MPYQEIREEEKIDLIAILDKMMNIIKKYIKPLSLFVVVGALVGLLVCMFTYKPMYSSEALFIVTLEDGKSIYSVSQSSEELNSRFSSMIKSEYMNKIIMEDLELNYVPANVSVSLIPETNLLQLTTTSNNPQNAYDVADSIIRNYSKVTQYGMSNVKLVMIDTPKLAKKSIYSLNHLDEALKGGIIAFGIGITFFLLYSVLNRTISKEKDVREYLHLNYLTGIPAINTGKRSVNTNDAVLVRMENTNDAYREAYRTLRIEIENDHKQNNRNVYLFTSIIPNEGKSTVALNVASMLANKGNKVLLIDFDLRNPSQFRYLDVNILTDSLSNYLKGNVDLLALINKESSIKNLHLIGNSKADENAAELLNPTKIEELIKTMKKVYDYVIVDVPPLTPMGDTSLIATYTDTSIVVIKQDLTNANVILDVLHEYNEETPDILGVVLNQMATSFFSLDETGYGYGYGYGEREKKKLL